MSFISNTLRNEKERPHHHSNGQSVDTAPERENSPATSHQRDDCDVTYSCRKKSTVTLSVDSGGSHEGPEKPVAVLNQEKNIEGSARLVPARYKLYPDSG